MTCSDEMHGSNHKFSLKEFAGTSLRIVMFQSIELAIYELFHLTQFLSLYPLLLLMKVYAVHIVHKSFKLLRTHRIILLIVIINRRASLPLQQCEFKHSFLTVIMTVIVVVFELFSVHLTLCAVSI